MTDARPSANLRRLLWDRSGTPSVASVTERLRGEGVEPHPWSNPPGDRYATHQHGYTKLLMCAAGSITFLVGPDAVPVELTAGDGFVLPSGTAHAAIVGPAGCTCLEGHRPEGVA
jgi:quercetin dioxygenase-like cupin family protein